ncbi:MAG: hypothetical protein LBN21_13585 [Treponema sp.]|jgi:tetratricopeptide (TPR) repeat protein|nr:hypothetical protein [Treponema sp.]
MMQTLFFLRYKPQLRRTRPELIADLDRTVIDAIEDAGGTLTGEKRYISAVFDENALGFWLNILILSEKLMKKLEAVTPDLYGYTLLVSCGTQGSAEAVCRIFSAGPEGGGIFLDPAAKKGLAPYAVFETPKSRNGERPRRKKIDTGSFVRIKELNSFSADPEIIFPLRETILRALRQGKERSSKNAVLFGNEFIGKRDGLYQFCKEIAGETPPLIIRFGSGGLTSLIDAWSPQIEALSGGGEIRTLWEQLFRERLRDENAPYMLRQCRRYFTLLLETYAGSAKQRGIIILENIQKSEADAALIFLEVYGSFPGRQELPVFGTCSREGTMDPEDVLKQWGGVFPRVIKLNTDGASPQGALTMSEDLWEIAYALVLLGKYFPAVFFRRLLLEEGGNPDMLSRAVNILSALGIVDAAGDPRPRIGNFIPRAEAILGARKENIRGMVRKRLLSWVGENKLSPCFALLEILSALGGGRSGAEAGDELILTSIAQDLINGTYGRIESAIAGGALQKITGKERVGPLLYLINTMKALVHGDEDQIRAAFKEDPPDCSFSPVLRAQVLANLTAYHLGVRDVKAALDTVKEAILLSQGRNRSAKGPEVKGLEVKGLSVPVLAQSYRLFALANLSKHQVGETIDYLGFAVENAEKTGAYELGISAYYEAASQFLFGNVSKAKRLIVQAGEQAASSGRPEWADRSRFLRGRISFETGHYREALEIFENLRKHPAGPPSVEKDNLLAAWIYRAKVYFQNPLIMKPAEVSFDADLFEVEASYLAGNYRKTVELARALANFREKENFLYTEQPDWRSGFAQCELLYFSRGELWDRIISVYHALALCRIPVTGGSENSAREEALHTIQRVLRDERLTEMDPWDAFYFYAWYRVLEETGAAQVDMNTAVSMAFKRLQRRASRIDDIETRRAFLSQPRWNSALSQAAREYKLI